MLEAYQNAIISSFGMIMNQNIEKYITAYDIQREII